MNSLRMVWRFPEGICLCMHMEGVWCKNEANSSVFIDPGRITVKLWQLSDTNSFRSVIALSITSAPLTQVSNSFSMQKTAIRTNLPTVALIKGEESPMLFRHSLLMKSVTPLGKLWKCAFTLFFKIRPLNERVGSSATENKQSQHLISSQE